MNAKLDSRWLSVDPANKTGLAWWVGQELLAIGTLRKMGSKGKWVGKYSWNRSVYENEWEAVHDMISQSRQVIIEEGFGGFAKAVGKQGEYRGFWRAACQANGITLTVVNVSEWRRVIKETFNVSWPATTERKKALAVKLVKEHYRRDVGDDEADAILLGHAAIRMGLVGG